MGGVEYAVPIGIVILLYFLFPAFLKNRQHRLVEGMRERYRPTLIRAGEITLIGRWFRFPAAVVLTRDYIVVQNVFSLYPDEVPFERLRKLNLQYKPTSSIPHPEDDAPDGTGKVLIITTTEQFYRMLFENPEDAMDWKSDIERAV
jgi:hypothetical protein